jgi:hypothetical protein
MRSLSPPRLIWLLVFVSTACAAIVAAQRHRVEAENKAVHLVADLADVRAIAAGEGVPLKQALIRLQRAGLTAVAVSEDTFNDLLVSGRLVPTSRPVGADGDGQLFVCPDEGLADRIRRAVAARFPKWDEAQPAPAIVLGPDGKPTRLPGTPSDLAKYGIGLDAEVCGLIQRLGLQVLARVWNPPGATERLVRAAILDAAENGAVGVIFNGDQTLGWRESVREAARFLRGTGDDVQAPLWYGTVEFVQQAGDSIYKEEMQPHVLRVHSMLAAEMDRASPDEAVDRFVLAVTDRNVRVCYLRPPSPASPEPVKAFAKFVWEVNKRLRAEGYEAKPAHPLEEPSASEIARYGVVLGVSCFVAWFGMALLPGLFWMLSSWIVVFAAAGLAVAANDPRPLALLAALAFPTWAMVALYPLARHGGSRAWWVLYLLICGVSVVGGLHVAALLTELPFMLQMKQFMGVKLAHFLPPAAVAVYLVAEESRLAAALGAPVRWGAFLLMVVVAGALGYMLIRTGNDAPSQVSGFELKLRSLLDRLLPVRPRTKEFLVGHPVLVLGLSMLSHGDRRLLPLIGGVAAIGQVSIVNTFAHLHTPIATSAVRVLLGMLLGLVLGLVLRWVWSRYFREAQRSLL